MNEAFDMFAVWFSFILSFLVVLILLALNVLHRGLLAGLIFMGLFFGLVSTLEIVYYKFFDN